MRYDCYFCLQETIVLSPSNSAKINWYCAWCGRLQLASGSEEEEWKTIKGWDYKVSNRGRVRRSVDSPSSKAGRILKGTVTKDGYLRVLLSDGYGSVKNLAVHILVCQEFNGPPPYIGAQVRHLDDNKSNFDPSNLCWGNATNNAEDRERNRYVRAINDVP